MLAAIKKKSFLQEKCPFIGCGIMGQNLQKHHIYRHLAGFNIIEIYIFFLFKEKPFLFFLPLKEKNVEDQNENGHTLFINVHNLQIVCLVCEKEIYDFDQ